MGMTDTDDDAEINSLADEGLARNNLEIRLIKLERFEDAREEIHRAIECKRPYGHAAEPWKTWEILNDLETAVGDPAAADARKQAMDLFLAYRRDGGENRETGGRICAMVEQAINTGQTEEIEKQLTQIAAHPETVPAGKLLASKLKALLSGSRDPDLWEDPGVWYMDAVELRMLMEKVGQ